MPDISDASPSALIQQLTTSPKAFDRTKAAQDLADYVYTQGLPVLSSAGILASLTDALQGRDGVAREGAVVAVDLLIRKYGKQSGTDPVFNPLIPLLLDRTGDAGKADAVAKSTAEKALKQLMKVTSPELAPKTIEYLFAVIEDSSAKWRARVVALNLLGTFATSSVEQVAERLGQYVPRLTGAMRDTKADISSKAYDTAILLCKVLTNPDIQPFVPVLVKCMADPTTVPAAIKTLSSTVWVREVDGPTLAVLGPLFERALVDRSTTVQRQTVVLITNVFKLIRVNDLAALHSESVRPGVERIIASAAFPEIRAFAEEARKAIDAAVLGARIPAIDHIQEAAADEAVAAKELTASLTAAGVSVDAFASASVEYVASAVAQLVRRRSFDVPTWERYFAPYLRHFASEAQIATVLADTRAHWLAIDKERNRIEEEDADDEEGEIVCDLPFSLAYGGLLLLNNAALKLRRGHRYGICGTNGCGKSTLLKAIQRKQIENIPEDLKSAYVEHDIENVEGLTVAGLMLAEPRISADEAEIRATLLEMGFSAERQDAMIESLSGGWKMRAALCRAMLMKVDLLLLDEPTNHLDVQSVAWLQDYLNAQKHVTCMIISHDSGFLDAVCTNIIHYEQKRLVYYQGNLAKFVEKYPPGKSYYTLSDDVVKFVFPPPGSLMGVRSQTRAILKMTGVTFTYPGAVKPQLHNVSCSVSLSSRVGIIGPNGAGKSTLIKVLTGETLPDTGRIEKHPNLRVAYVAQHAFHHIEQHLEKSAVQYIQWRYQDGVDKEQALKATRQLSPAEEALIATPIVGKTGEARLFERIVGRQKLKKSYMYEIKWQNLEHRFNSQLSRERLLELGFQKMVQEFDDFEASREGSGSREMSLKLIRKHLEDVGLDGDIAEYNEMKGLSGGQKVKVVIAAAMWSKPQVLILDEPTNFLDRDALGGLAVGIREWTGAFLCISHNQEFISALCSEIWNVEDGHLTLQGKTSTADENFESVPTSKVNTPGSATPLTGNATPATSDSDAQRVEETVAGVDASLKFKAAKGKKKMTRAEKKAQEERRRLRTIAFLSNSIPGAQREPDTDSDDDDEKKGKPLRRKAKEALGGTPLSGTPLSGTPISGSGAASPVGKR